MVLSKPPVAGVVGWLAGAGDMPNMNLAFSTTPWSAAVEPNAPELHVSFPVIGSAGNLDAYAGSCMPASSVMKGLVLLTAGCAKLNAESIARSILSRYCMRSPLVAVDTPTPASESPPAASCARPARFHEPLKKALVGPEDR